VTYTQQLWLICIACQTGILAAFCIVGTVTYDLIAVKRGWRTVSEETLLLGRRFPALALFVASFVSLITGILIGHLFLPQYIVGP
jgi:hypothetical protein